MKDISTSSVAGLARSALRGFSWNLAGNFVRVLAGFIINILLARLLGPQPFGLVALALIFIGMGNLLIESGLSVVLVQKKDISENEIAYVFTMQMMLSIILAGSIFISAPLLALFLKDPAVTPVLRLMSLILIFQAFAQVPTALLRRQLDFKTIQKIQIGTYLFCYIGIGIPLALLGLGVWSLVFAQVIQSALSALLIYLVARHPLTLIFRGHTDLKAFGLRILGANIANYIIQNIDNLIVGWAFGSFGLGLYSRAYYLGMTPIGVAVTPVQGVLMPAISRIGNQAHAARIFIAVFTAFAVGFIPPYVLLALGAEDFISILLGTKWELAAPLLVPIALATPLFALMAIEGPVLIGLGKPEYELSVQWKTAVFAVVVLLVASRISLNVLAWGILLIYGIRLILMTIAIRKVLDISWNQIIHAFTLGLLLAGIVASCWWMSEQMLPLQWALWIRVSLQSLVAIGVWIVLLVLGRTMFFKDGYEILLSLNSVRNAS